MILWATFECLAQTPALPPTEPSSATPGPAVIEDPLGRTSPYGTVVGFMRAAQRGNFELAGDFLDTKQNGDAREELARNLSQTMNSGLKVDLDQLSRAPEGNLEDGLRRTRDRVGEIKSGNQILDILLDRVERKDGPPIWLFSSETILALPDFVQQQEMMEPTWFETYFPKPLLEKTLWKIPLYRLIFVPLLLLLALGIAWGITWLLAAFSRLAFRRPSQAYVVVQRVSLVGPIRLLLFAILVSLGGRYGITLLIRHFWNRVATILIVGAIVWLSLRIIDLVAQNVTSQLARKGAPHKIAVIHLFRVLAKAVAVIIALLLILHMQGVDLTTALAGVGIGGVAIAFAAQKTIENLFGTVMLVIDQSLRVGDFCRVGETLGTIEEIGLRSTRIRTLERTVVSVPNGQAASTVTENFAPRDKVWFRHTFGLRHETSADQLRFVLARIRELLYEHPKVESSSARIRFVRFSGSSLDLDIFAYVLAIDYAVFLEIQEDLLLRIMDIIETSGTGVAFPSQTTYLAKDSGLDSEKTKEVVTQVQRWKQDKSLPFPNYPPEKIAEIADSLEYPPPDSALHER